MSKEEIFLSVIIPVYNKETIIKYALPERYRYLQTQKYNFEIIAIDDASTDNTLNILNELTNECPNIHLIHNPKNMRKGYSVKKGILASRGKYILVTDADYAYPISQLPRFIKTLDEGYDLAIGCRVLKESTYTMHPSFFPYVYSRHLISRTFNLIVRMFLVNILDTQCGFKCFKSEVAKDIFKKQLLNDFSYEVEILYIAKKYNYKIKELPVEFIYKKEPTSIRLIQDATKMLIDLFRIKKYDWNGKYGATRISNNV